MVNSVTELSPSPPGAWTLMATFQWSAGGLGAATSSFPGSTASEVAAEVISTSPSAVGFLGFGGSAEVDASMSSAERFALACLR